MAQRYGQNYGKDDDNFNTNANRQFGGGGNEYDRNDNIPGPQRESLRNDFTGRSGDTLSVSRRSGTSSSSFGMTPWDAAVDRAVQESEPVDRERYGNVKPQVSYRGRGPKNYQRSDERIHEHLCEILTEDPLIDAREIEMHCSNGVVTLEGTVESRQLKHRVEDIVVECSGVKDVQNNLRVQRGTTHQ